jgi:S-adenosyl methyltransferase
VINPHADLAAARAGSDRLFMQPDFNPTVANVARVYDCLLGGKDNFAADRQAAARLLDAVPGAAVAARENRAFLGRAVRFLAEDAGICQFLDIGAGLPSARAVHEIVRGNVPMPRVVYADCEPMVVRHAEALLGGSLTAAVVRADVRQPWDLFARPAVRSLINLAEPVAILLVAILHFIEDHEDPWAVVNCYKDMMAPGSYLVISHVTPDDVTPDAGRKAQEVYANATAQAHPRTRDAVTRFFDGLELAGPGVVSVSAWRPESLVAQPDGRTLLYAGVARKPLEQEQGAMRDEP